MGSTLSRVSKKYRKHIIFHSHLMPYRSMMNSLGVQKMNVLLLEGGISVSLYPVAQVIDSI